MNDVVFIHYRHDKNTPRGGVTLALEMEPVPKEAKIDGNTRPVIAFAMAACHPKDNFCKHTGRTKASGRLKSERYRVVPPPNTTLGEFLKTKDDFPALARMFSLITDVPVITS